MRWGRRKPDEVRPPVPEILREPFPCQGVVDPPNTGLLEQLPAEALAGVSIDAFITDAFVGWSDRDAAYLRELIAQSRRFG